MRIGRKVVKLDINRGIKNENKRKRWTAKMHFIKDALVKSLYYNSNAIVRARNLENFELTAFHNCNEPNFLLQQIVG